MIKENRLPGMNDIRVTTDSLVVILRKNMDEHRALFTKAVEGYKIEATKQLEQRLRDITNSNGIIRVNFGLVPPEDHTSDYEAAIKALELSVDDEIHLDAQEFRQYVMNEWDWFENVTASNTLYASNVRR